MKYRSHRGSLSDSLDTEVEVDCISELLKHINSYRKGFPLPEVRKIQIEFYAHDDRVPADLYMVCEVTDDNKVHALGFISEDVETPKNHSIFEPAKK